MKTSSSGCAVRTQFPERPKDKVNRFFCIFLGRFFAPVAAGIAIGLLAGFDPLFEQLHFLLPASMARSAPYVGSVAAVGSFLFLYFFITKYKFLFEKRYEIAIFITLAAAVLSGVNAGPLDPTDFAYLGVGMFWLVVMLIERRPMLTPLPVIAMLVVLVCFSLFSIINGGSHSLMGQRTYLTKIFMMVVISHLASTHELLRFTLKTFVTLAILSALSGIVIEIIFLQTGYAFTMDDLGEYVYKQTPFQDMLRSAAFMPRAQAQAHLMILAAAIMSSLPARPVMRWAGMTILLLGLFFAFSVNAYLVMIVVLTVALFLWRPRYASHFTLTIIMGGLVICFMNGFDVLMNIFGPSAGGPANDRIEYMRIGSLAVANHPWFGLGLNNIARVLYTPVHNAYFQTAVEMGLLAGLTLLALVVYIVIMTGVTAMRTPSSPERAWLKGLFLAELGLALHIFFEPYYDNYLTWVVMGMGVAAIGLHSFNPLRGRRLWPQPPGKRPVYVDYWQSLRHTGPTLESEHPPQTARR